MSNNANNPLKSLPNIGEILAEELVKVGVCSEDDLKRIGSEKAFMRIRAIDKSACMCKLMALEGAIEGIRWHNLPPDKKEELRFFYKQISDIN
jgi:DNA transformation protein